MKSFSSFHIFVITFVVSFQGVSAQMNSAVIPVRQVFAKEGNSVNFSCESSGAPISNCLWERVNARPVVISFDPSNARHGQSSSIPGYSYLGNGLDRGSCGIVINNVRDEHVGDWACTLISSVKGIFRGSVQVNILKKPTPPEFSRHIDVQQIANFIDNESYGRLNPSLYIICSSTNGVPAPTFKWYIGDRELTREDRKPFRQTTYQSGDTVISKNLLNYSFTWRDNGKFLRCVLEHEALTENDTKEVAQLIGVLFIPRAEDFDESVASSLGESVTLALNISSNPKPDTRWEFDGEGMFLGPISSDGRYKANILEIAPGVIECRLVIAEVKCEDLTRLFRLRARNPLGENIFEFRISSNSSSCNETYKDVIGNQTHVDANRTRDEYIEKTQVLDCINSLNTFNVSKTTDADEQFGKFVVDFLKTLDSVKKNDTIVKFKRIIEESLLL